MGKASLPKTPINDTLDANRDRKKQFGRERAAFSRVPLYSTSIGSGINSTSDSSITSVVGLSTAGGTMMGPIAFYPQSQTISNGTINVSSSNAYSSRVVVGGQGAASDDLEVILNASHAGQILFFQPVTVGHTITLQDYKKTATAWATSTSYSIGNVVLDGGLRYTCYTAHTSSSATDPGTGATWATVWYRNNIHIPGATEKIIQANEIVLLQYDQSSTATWTLVSGGGTGEVFDWTAAHRANGNTLFLDPSDVSGIKAPNDNEIKLFTQNGGNTFDRLTINNTDAIFNGISLTPTNNFTQMIGGSGTGEQWDKIYVDELKMLNSTSNITTTAQGAVFINSTTGLTLKSQTLTGTQNYGKTTFTDGDGVTRIEFDYSASAKSNKFNYSTQGIVIRKNADPGDTIDVVPTGNALFGNNAYINANGTGWFSSNPNDGLIISRVGLEQMRFRKDEIILNTELHMNDELINMGGNSSIDYNPSTNKLNISAGTGDGLAFSSINTVSFVITAATGIAYLIGGSTTHTLQDNALVLGTGVDLVVSSNLIDFTNRSTPSSSLFGNGAMYSKSVSGTTTPMWWDGTTETSMLGGSGSSGANTSLSNLTSTGEAHFASPSLNNLSSPTLNDDINANGNYITNLQRIAFDGQSTSYGGIAGAIWYSGSGTSAKIKVRDGSSTWELSSGGGSSWNGNATGDLDMNGNDIDDAGTVQIDTLSSNAGAIYMDKQLGMSTSVRINFNVGSTSTGQGSQRSKPSSTCEGYFNIKVGNANKRVAYYS